MKKRDIKKDREIQRTEKEKRYLCDSKVELFYPVDDCFYFYQFLCKKKNKRERAKERERIKKMEIK